jgi:hypothetical protein
VSENLRVHVRRQNRQKQKKNKKILKMYRKRNRQSDDGAVANINSSQHGQGRIPGTTVYYYNYYNKHITYYIFA